MIDIFCFWDPHRRYIRLCNEGDHVIGHGINQPHGHSTGYVVGDVIDHVIVVAIGNVFGHVNGHFNNILLATRMLMALVITISQTIGHLTRSFMGYALAQ